MNNFFKSRMVALILCVATLFTLSACGSDPGEDTSFVTPELEPIRIEATAGGNITMPAEFSMPTEAGKMSVGYTGTQMFGGFTLISTRGSDYFTVSGPITVTLSANLKRLIDEEYKEYTTEEQYSKLAVALFKKDGNFSQYISSAYFLANDTTYQATFDNIDTAAEYRFVISYTDVARVRITGTFNATNITSAPIPAVDDDSNSSDAE